MSLFVGTKIVDATPMTRGEYNRYRGWEIPENENPDDTGFLVEYLDGGESNHPGHTGYISWCPKNVFHKANVAMGGSTDLPGYVVRMYAELAELNQRLRSAKTYLASSAEDQRDPLLEVQVGVMTEYARVLNKRITAASTK